MRGLDPGFVGPAYASTMVLQSAQTCINWYLEIAQDKDPKMPVALLGCPGLHPVISGTTGPVRGMWALPGGLTALVVISSTVYLLTITQAATQTNPPSFSLTSVGSLQTNSGPVCIRDNGVIFGGAGGYALIVDGLAGYIYNIAGARTVSFTGSVTSGSAYITLPGSIPYGLAICGATLSDTSGYVPAGTTIAAMNYASPQIQMSANATGTNASDTFSITIPAFAQLTDPGFPSNPQRIAFIEGWLLVNSGGSRTFQTSGPTPYTMLWPPSFYALKDSSTDNLITMQENNREIWMVGERTSEVWYNAGNQNFSFARVPAVGPQIGCGAYASMARLGNDLAWLAKNEQGENIVVRTRQYSWERISNHAIEHALTTYPVINDAIAYAYEEEGHLFYVLTFPTADVTWVFDATTNMWHQRQSMDSAGNYHRHRSNCYMDFANMRIVGDYLTGQLHQMSRNYYTDNGATIRCQRRTAPLWSKSDRKRLFHGALQVEFTPGVGLQTGQGSNPQAMMRWSNDGGFTWSNEHWTGIGAVGQTKNRAVWRRLGRARDRVYELNYTDPTPRDIIGATLFVDEEEAA